MKRFRLFSTVFFSLAMMAGYAVVPGGYYDTLEGQKGLNLRKRAKSIVADHTAISYSGGTWEAFLETDTRMVNGVRCWWDMYSADNVPAPSSSSHSGMNVEHAIANSWWGGTKNTAYKDLFNLNPSNSNANSRKGNYPLAEIQGEPKWTNGVTSIGTPKNGQGGGNGQCFEPLDEYKGDFARGIFYMFTVYDDIAWQSKCAWMFTPNTDQLLQDWAVEMLLRWAKEDPVSQKEIDRNEAIYKVQGNRNPYIDIPQLVDYVWGDKQDIRFSFSGIDYPDDPIPDDPIDPIPDDPTPVDPVNPDNGRWNMVTSESMLNGIDEYVILTAETHIPMSSRHYLNNNGTAGYFYDCAAAGVLTDASGEKYLSSLPEGTAVIRLIPSGSGYVLSVYNSENGEHEGYITSSQAKHVTLTDSPTSSGSAIMAANISVSSDRVTISYGSNGLLQYNSGAPRFTTYTSSQTPLMMYSRKNDITTVVNCFGLESEVQVYNLHGVKVGEGNREKTLNSLPAGLYIVVGDGKAEKISKY